jgi:hypothetical protein
MAIYKRVAGNLIVETVGATDTVTFQGLTANATTVIIDGDLSVTGNASLLGNISGDRIFNGTTEIEIPTPSGNATISVGGVSNVAVFTSAGANVSGTLDVTGAVTTGSTLSVTGNITGANINTSGNVFITRDASNGQPTIRFVDTDDDIANNQVFGAIEWFTSDVSNAGPRVTAGIRSAAEGVLGNAYVQILTSTGGAAETPKVHVDSIGNVGVGNILPVHLLSVNGTIYGSSTTEIVGNVTGGNIVTAGLVTATGNLVTGANVVAAGYANITGNVNAGNVVSVGLVSAGSAGISTTGNVTGGNVNSVGSMSATNDVTASNFFTVNDGNVTVQGNITANNAAISNSLTTTNVVVTGSSSGTGIGVDNIVWQDPPAVIEPSAVANVGILGFTALENYVYKFTALLPVIPEGSTTSTFAVLFDSGACNYVVEAQETATSVFSAASSNTSDSAISRTMTGTDLRFVRISGTFTHAGNVDVAIRASTSAANLTVNGGAHLTYTRIG